MCTMLKSYLRKEKFEYANGFAKFTYESRARLNISWNGSVTLVPKTHGLMLVISLIRCGIYQWINTYFAETDIGLWEEGRVSNWCNHSKAESSSSNETNSRCDTSRLHFWDTQKHHHVHNARKEHACKRFQARILTEFGKLRDNRNLCIVRFNKRSKNVSRPLISQMWVIVVLFLFELKLIGLGGNCLFCWSDCW